MKHSALVGLAGLLFLAISHQAYAGYRVFLDPRAMALGGSGVAASTKFNASFHNPALIAFSKGDKPDKIYLSVSQGLRETKDTDFERAIEKFQNDGSFNNFVNSVPSASNNREIAQQIYDYRDTLRQLDLSSYRKDETVSFSLLADTQPLTINFFVREDQREIFTIRNQDEALLGQVYDEAVNSSSKIGLPDFEKELGSSVDEVFFELKEFGATVATTNVIEYNIPISWGFTPKLIEMHGAHSSAPLQSYDLGNPPVRQISRGLLEWNLDIGFAALLTDNFLREELGLDGFWLEGEWVFGMVAMNMFPTDFTPYFPARDRDTYPGTKRAIQGLYQLGLAHYREDFMITMDVDLTEHEVWDFEGTTRFITLGGEYYWRDDFHLRAGMRFNTAQTSESGQDQALFTGGFLYQPHGFSIEAAAVFNGVEKGGTLGIGLAF